jgi:hypothetical protein
MLNISGADSIHLLVRRFRNIFFALIACLWLPTFAHCQIEALTGLELLQCNTTCLATGNPGHDSGKDICCPVEKSQYKSDQPSVSLPPPALFSVLMIAQQRMEQFLPAKNLVVASTTTLPQLPKAWHFLSRMALPVRAPSFVS